MLISGYRNINIHISEVLCIKDSYTVVFEPKLHKSLCNSFAITGRFANYGNYRYILGLHVPSKHVCVYIFLNSSAAWKINAEIKKTITKLMNDLPMLFLNFIEISRLDVNK